MGDRQMDRWRRGGVGAGVTERGSRGDRRGQERSKRRCRKDGREGGKKEERKLIS